MRAMFRILKEYLSTMEEFLDSRAGDLRIAETEYLLQKGWSISEIEAGARNGDEASAIGLERMLARFTGFYGPSMDPSLECYFPNLLRRSLFIAAYSVFEDALCRRCEILQENYDLGQSVDFRDEGIWVVKSYLAETIDLDLERSEEWSEITCYNKLRNCIVHNNGRLRDCRYSRFLGEYISRHSFLNLNDLLGEVELEEGFCEEVIETFDAFEEYLDVCFEEKLRAFYSSRSGSQQVSKQ